MQTVKACLVCGKSLKVKKGRGRPKVTCSPKCRMDLYLERKRQQSQAAVEPKTITETLPTPTE